MRQTLRETDSSVQGVSRELLSAISRINWAAYNIALKAAECRINALRLNSMNDSCLRLLLQYNQPLMTQQNLEFLLEVSPDNEFVVARMAAFFSRLAPILKFRDTKTNSFSQIIHYFDIRGGREAQS